MKEGFAIVDIVVGNDGGNEQSVYAKRQFLIYNEKVPSCGSEVGVSRADIFR